MSIAAAASWKCIHAKNSSVSYSNVIFLLVVTMIVNSTHMFNKTTYTLCFDGNKSTLLCWRLRISWKLLEYNLQNYGS